MNNSLLGMVNNYKLCNDITHYNHDFDVNIQITLIYCDAMCERTRIDREVLPELYRLYQLNSFSSIEAIEMDKKIPFDLIEQWEMETLDSLLFSGKIVISFNHLNKGYSLSIANLPNRKTEETNIEVAIRGPKDGLVEDIETNIGLIRKRLPVASVSIEKFSIGTITKTKVGLIYHNDKINKETLTSIRDKLRQTEKKIEELISANQLEELISDAPYTLFPLTVYTGRPDFIASCLLRGRFIVLIDGVPGAMVAPINLFMLLKTPEDTHFNYISASFGRLLRLLSLISSIFLPSFYVALTSYHQDQIPFGLLATITITRFGIPLSVPLEMFLILLLLEIFKEAGFRLPSAIGQTLTVVGGIIIGDAAIRAGLISPTMIVVAAMSIVASSTLVSQTLTGAVSILRFFAVIFSSVLGMYGFMMSLLFFTVYLTKLYSFGVPYLAPISPITMKDIIRSLIMVPSKFKPRIPKYLKKNK
ncbi:MAG: spore germination protein [Candidatus Cohnella colombiensis]|uniref:Spore germination protein n=1 Tax=Candidatus Cohnella colombiensis TaxID=3121368 RepID=A0AA95EZP9_9BACL|nr:MAG: spore germination protein [Cohnella sp.]